MDRTEVFISFGIVALFMVIATIAVIRSQQRYDLFKSPPPIIKVSINSVRMEASNALFHRHAGERDSGGNVRRRQWA
jgi:hypothetical protein